MDIDVYLRNIEIISDRYCNMYDIKVIDLAEPYPVDQHIIDTLMNMVEVKKQIITTDEIKRSNIANNRTINSLNIDTETKLMITAIYNEICSKTDEKRFFRSMEKYQCEQPIFKDNDLHSHVRSCGELINYSALQWHKMRSVCQYVDKYYRVHGYIKDEILDFIHSKCAGYTKYIRLDPYFCSDTMPLISLREEAVRPVDPSWIKNLTLFRRQKTGGHYILQNPTEIQNEMDRLKWWEYSILGIRSLEISAQRNNSGNLSMMIEEITEKQQYDAYYVAKCIHLDSENEVGTNINDAILNHIDIALNIYNANAYKERRGQRLSDGRVVDATFRTHLLRLESVPFKTLVYLTSLFFESQTLTREWLTEQF